MEDPIDDRFLKLEHYASHGELSHPYLAGLAMGLLIQIYEAGGQDLFIPDDSFLWHFNKR